MAERRVASTAPELVLETETGSVVAMLVVLSALFGHAVSRLLRRQEPVVMRK